DPHRGVREGRLRARAAARRRRARRRAPAPAAHPDDVVRVHPRLRAAVDRQGSGGGRPADPRHDGHLRDARRDGDRRLPHPRAFRRHRAPFPHGPAPVAVGGGIGAGGGLSGMRRPACRAASGILVLALAGCAVGPNYQRPQVPVPEGFYGDARAAEARSFADAPWWDGFAAPILKGLVDEAIRNGFDARLAAARVEEARARFGIARSELFPAVDYGGSWQRGRANRFFDPTGEAQTAWTANV